MLKRIAISNYKSLKDLRSLSLSPISIIIGPNASGKSNLLDAIQLISRAATRRNLKEAFEEHRGFPLESFFYGDCDYDRLLSRDSLQMHFEIDVELSDSVVDAVERIVREKRKGTERAEGGKRVIVEKFLRYRLGIEVLPKTGHLRVVDERLQALKSDGHEKKRKPFVERICQNGHDKIHLRMEGQAHPTYHDVFLDHTIVSMALYEPHYPHITALRMELANWHVFYLEPKKLMREETPISDIRHIGPRGENLAAFLNSLYHRERKSFDNLNLTFSMIVPGVTKVVPEPTRDGLVGLRLFENDASYSARLVSEGTLRVLGLLAAVHPSSPATMIAYEEPENGVHPVRLKIIADILKSAAKNHNKQIIATTHSPIFPTYFKSENLFVARKEGPISSILEFKSCGPLFKEKDIETALEDCILRGDFGG